MGTISKFDSNVVKSYGRYPLVMAAGSRRICTDENNNEYWLARELQNVLGYHQWRSINELIERAKVAFKESEFNIEDDLRCNEKW